MLKQSLAILAGSFLLVACSTQAPTPATKTPDELAKEYFVLASMNAVRTVGIEANPEWQAGSFEMVYVLDRQNQLLDCKARPASNAKNSGGFAYNPQLAERMNSLCWQTVLPPIPAHMFDEGASTEIVAPLQFPLRQVDAARQARSTAVNQRSAYFWRHLFADQPIDSIGKARLIGMLDEHRNVLGCQVIIEPHRLRRRDFKQDNSLLDHLGHACATLRDVPLVPGQKPNAQGQHVFIVNLDYSPWRHKAGDSHEQ